MVFAKLRRGLHWKTKKYDVVGVYGLVLKFSSLAATNTLRTDGENESVSRSLVLTTLTALNFVLNLIRLPYMPIGIKQLEIAAENSTSVIHISTQNFAIRLIVPITIIMGAIPLQAITLASMHKKQPIIIEGLKTIDVYLKYPSSKCKTETRIVLCIFFFLLIVVVLMMTHSLLTIKSTANYIVFGCNIYCLFSTLVVECQFHVLCLLTVRRFKFLNTKILEFQRRILGFNANFLDAQYLVRKKQAITRTELLILKMTHQKLVETCQNIAEYFSKPLFFLLTSCAVNGFMNLYFAIFGGFKVTEPDQGRPCFVILAQLIWALYHFLCFIALCVMADSLAEEAKKTKVHVAQALNFLRDPTNKKELKSFLSYAVVKKVEFLVCGFFRMDTALITSAIATGSTYLIVLVQFHQK